MEQLIVQLCAAARRCTSATTIAAARHYTHRPRRGHTLLVDQENYEWHLPRANTFINCITRPRLTQYICMYMWAQSVLCINAFEYSVVYIYYTTAAMTARKLLIVTATSIAISLVNQIVHFRTTLFVLDVVCINQ